MQTVETRSLSSIGIPSCHELRDVELHFLLDGEDHLVLRLKHVRAVPGKSKDVHVVGLRPLAAAYANVGPVVVQNQQVGLCLVHILVPHLQVFEKCYIIHIAIFCSRGKDVFDGAVLGDIRLDAT